MHDFRTALISVWKGEMGIRHISAYLKQNDYPVDLLFCPQYADQLYNESQLESIIRTVGNHDLVGISCSTEMSKRRVVQIVEELRKQEHKPFIVLGGNAATFTPEPALKYVDAVCIGEGEKPTLDLVERLRTGENIYLAPTIWTNENKVVRCVAGKSDDLDVFPTIDYGFSGEDSGRYYRLIGDSLIEIKTPEESILDIDRITTVGRDPLFQERTSILFYSSSRGCVSFCAYCQSPRLNEIYGGGRIKKRSINLVIDDLQRIIAKHPNIGEVSFWDDDFFVRTVAEIEEFSKEYNTKIGLPLFVYASPRTLNEKKLEALTRAGKLTVNIGLQSGSERVLRDVYDRRGQTNEKAIRAVTFLSDYARAGVIETPWIDFIVNNPWATPEDVKEDVYLVQRLPKPFDLHVHSLELLPNSALYERAVQEGKVKPVWDFVERPTGLMATAELQDFTEHVKELQVGEHAYYTLLMYCLAGSNVRSYNGSIPSDRLDWLLGEQTKEKKDFLVEAFFNNHRVRHYLQERVNREETEIVIRERVESVLREKLDY